MTKHVRAIICTRSTLLPGASENASQQKLLVGATTSAPSIFRRAKGAGRVQKSGRSGNEKRKRAVVTTPPLALTLVKRNVVGHRGQYRLNGVGAAPQCPMNCALLGSRFMSPGAMMAFNKPTWASVGADLSRPQPIYRPSGDVPVPELFC